MSTLRKRGSRRARILLTSLLAATPAVPACAGVGDVDPAYGRDGHGELRFDEILSYGPAVVGPDGAVYIGLRESYFDFYGNGLVAKLGADGRADPGWNVGTGRFFDESSELLGAMALRSDRRLVVAGVQRATTPLSSSKAEGAAALLDAAGNPDRGFGFEGIVRWRSPTDSSRVMQIAPRPEGRVVVAFAQSANDSLCGPSLELRQLLPDGREDPSFQSPGAATFSFPGTNLCFQAPTLATLADGRLIVAAGRRIYRLQPNGALDPAAPAPLLADSIPPWSLAAVRPAGELLLAGTTDDRRFVAGSGGRDLVLTRLRSDGSRDPAFGSLGDGVVALDLGRVVTATDGIDETLQSVAASADGQAFYVAVQLSRQAGTLTTNFGQIVARVLRDGRLDSRFGRGGIARLARYWVAPVIALDEQPSGALLAVHADGVVVRLLADDRPSAGAVQIEAGATVREGTDTRATLVVSRVGGADGALAVDWSTQDRDARAATPGNPGDFRSGNGRLEWASGDSSDRSIEIELVNDSSAERPEAFAVTLSGASVLRPSASVTIVDDDISSPTSAPGTGPAATGTSTGSAGSGGGGTLSIAWLLVALLAWLARAERVPGVPRGHAP